jgi:hypothetical protein
MKCKKRGKWSQDLNTLHLNLNLNAMYLNLVVYPICFCVFQQILN